MLSEGLRSYWRERGVTVPIHVIPRAVQPEIFDRPLGSEAQLMLTNLNGQLVLSQKIEVGTLKLPIATAGLPGGVYLVSVRMETGILTKKLVVAR